MRNILYELRKAAGITQQQISEQLGISQAAYCKIEKGQRKLQVPMAKKIALILGCEWWKLYED